MPEVISINDEHITIEGEIRDFATRFDDVAIFRYSDGEYLLHEADAGKDTFLVIRGAFVVERGQGSTRSHIAIGMATLDEPVFVGEVAYLGGASRMASILCSGTTYVLTLKPAHIESIIEGFPFLTRVLCRQFARRLKETGDTVQERQDQLQMNATQLFLSQGDVLFDAGDPADKLFQLVDGKVRLEGKTGVTLVSAAQLTRGFLEAGPFLAQGRHTSRAVAQGNVIAVAIDRSSTEAVIRNFPDVVMEALQNKG